MPEKGTKLEPFIKDVEGRIRYAVDWGSWLAKNAPADTLSTSAWAVISGTVTLESDVSNTTIASVLVVGGVSGEKAAIRNRVTTAGGQTNDQTIYIKVKDK